MFPGIDTVQEVRRRRLSFVATKPRTGGVMATGTVSESGAMVTGTHLDAVSW